MFSLNDVPQEVIEYIRLHFRDANKKVSSVTTVHPSMHEETLDHMLVMELTASPPTFFSTVSASVAIESHWLGQRWMYGRWEIADIGIVVMLRSRGHLICRKVTLFQSKRLHCEEIPVVTLTEDDYLIGIGRLVDRTDPEFPLTTQRAFNFKKNSKYKAIIKGDEQLDRIESYIDRTAIPVYYGLYNPFNVPSAMLYPMADVATGNATNEVGMRVVSFSEMKQALKPLKKGQSPSFGQITSKSNNWRLENFIADEVLKCREGVLFPGAETEPRLRELLYFRGSPITGLIAITIDLGKLD